MLNINAFLQNERHFTVCLPVCVSACLSEVNSQWDQVTANSSPFLAAAVDYLAKNVSLSSQRRMKLADHSAVLGLLQVETGQAY